MPRWLVTLLLALTACGSTARVVRLDTGKGEPIVFTPRVRGEPREEHLQAGWPAVEADQHGQSQIAQAVCTPADNTYSCCLKTHAADPEVCGADADDAAAAAILKTARKAAEAAARKWACQAQCNVQAIPGKAPATFPERVYGEGAGASESEACENAKHAATQSAPSGTYPRHCKCDCTKR
jgi:hypothetical protein